MSIFEERGVERQYGAMTVKAAKKAFEFSCNRCSATGKRNNCNGCAIADAHNNVIRFVLS